MEYIVAQYGEDRLLCLLGSLREGANIDAAFENCLTVPLYEIEEKWHEHIDTRTGWFTFLSIHVYELLQIKTNVYNMK